MLAGPSHAACDHFNAFHLMSASNPKINPASVTVRATHSPIPTAARTVPKDWIRKTTTSKTRKRA